MYYEEHCEDDEDERDPHCAELEAKYPECDEENYEGDLPCAPSEEDMTYYKEHCEDDENDYCDACVSSIILSELCYCLDEDVDCDESLIPAECQSVDYSCWFNASVQCNNFGTPEPTTTE